ncbi:glycosyltransferase family 4 protein [Winogradskyella sp. A2]|uniref:glycosyltransferase family 4 protein n=1 Tax=Winogradskyella sp. A2 TaxID=3366944 RepID=UPI00398C676A
MIKKLLIIGFVWPEPKSSAAGSRMLQLIEQFQNQNYRITFCSTANKSDNTFDLTQIGVTTESIILNDSSFDGFVKKLNPDIVLFDRFMTEEQFGWRISEQCPNTIRILDTEDFHGLRKGRELAIKANEDFSIEYLQNDVTKREITSIYRCDLSLIISKFEMDLLINDFEISEDLLLYLPFLIDGPSSKEKESLPNFKQRQNFIIIGNFLHAPNYDSILYLKQSIWPLIRKELPETELHIYGAYESQKVLQLNNSKEGFIIKGFAEDVNTEMQKSRVCLVPLRFGAGLKGKVFDAFKNGTPCVMSSIASEGIIENSELIQNNPKQYANKAIEFYTNIDSWNHAQEIGFNTLKVQFTKVVFVEKFRMKLTSLQKALPTHRQNNFIGQILMHQTMQSTKYMSKWIEEKNKN